MRSSICQYGHLGVSAVSQCSDTFKVWRDAECEFVANLRASQSRKNFENRLIFEERYGQDFSVFLFTVWKAFSIYTVSAKHRSTYMICFANGYFIVL